MFPDFQNDPKIILPERGLMRLRADWREPRGPVWRDKPGFSGCCCGCGYNSACCTGLVDTLHISFNNTTKCPPLDGQTFALTIAACTAATCTFGGVDHSAEAICSWVSPLQSCTGATFTISFACITIAGGSHFAWNCTNMGMAGPYTSNGQTVTCSPLHVPIDPAGTVNANGAAGKCGGGAVTAIAPVITT